MDICLAEDMDILVKLTLATAVQFLFSFWTVFTNCGTKWLASLNLIPTYCYYLLKMYILVNMEHSCSTVPKNAKIQTYHQKLFQYGLKLI